MNTKILRKETKVLIDMRKDLGVTQKKLAATLGYITSQYISNAERGLCGLAPDAIKKIRHQFGHSWAEKLIRAKVKDFEEQLRWTVK